MSFYVEAEVLCSRHWVDLSVCGVEVHQEVRDHSDHDSRHLEDLLEDDSCGLKTEDDCGSDGPMEDDLHDNLMEADEIWVEDCAMEDDLVEVGTGEV